MPIRAKLVEVTQELRHTRTRLLPIEIAERVQHTIVRIEQLAVSPIVDSAADESVIREARNLLDECAALLKA